MVQEPYDLRKDQKQQEKPLNRVHQFHQSMTEELMESLVSNGPVKGPSRPCRQDPP